MALLAPQARADVPHRYVDVGPVHCGVHRCWQYRHITWYNPSPIIKTQRRWRPAETRTGDCRLIERSSWSHWKTLSIINL